MCMKIYQSWYQFPVRIWSMQQLVTDAVKGYWACVHNCCCSTYHCLFSHSPPGSSAPPLFPRLPESHHYSCKISVHRTRTDYEQQTYSRTWNHRCAVCSHLDSQLWLPWKQKCAPVRKGGGTTELHCYHITGVPVLACVISVAILGCCTFGFKTYWQCMNWTVYWWSVLVELVETVCSCGD